MTAPVFAIHGIGNRDESAFAQTVAALGTAVGGNITARPVFWGDLGANYERITDTVPGAPVDSAEVRGDDAEPDPVSTALAHFLITGSARGTEIRTAATVPAPVLAAASDTVRYGPGASEEIRGEPTNEADVAAVRTAIAENWASTTWLPIVDDEQLMRAIGTAVAGPIADRAAESTESGAEMRGAEVRELDIGGFVRRRLLELDRVVGAAVDAVAGRLNTQLRTSFLPGIAQGVGDILVYQRHRETIRNRVRTVIDQVNPNLGRSREHPVDVVAHSLGGVIAVDMATSVEPLWIRQLVTFGSQSPFFHVCDPRGGALTPYTGTPVQLPDSIGAWTNLWEPLDPVAFVAARVFHLYDGTPPDDVKVPHLASSGLWTHSDYWTLDVVAQTIRQAFAERV